MDDLHTHLDRVRTLGERRKEELKEQQQKKCDLRFRVMCERARSEQSEQALISEFDGVKWSLQTKEEDADASRRAVAAQLHTILNSEMANVHKGDVHVPTIGATLGDASPLEIGRFSTASPHPSGIALSAAQRSFSADSGGDRRSADLRRLQQLKEQMRKRLQSEQMGA